MCICETGYAGDGLACHDINECETSENPCKDQSDNKCVNIEGGYICCDSKLNDQECIEEKGAYCSGGCGLHAVCMNQTCTCVDGFEGDPKIKCNDVNECDDESICPGVGQWCVNMIGGHICCGRDSTHPECKGLEINAFNGNFGKGSISNAQLTEARSRGFFTHIIEKGERQENSSGGVVVVVRGNESDASGEAISSNGITFSFEIPTCNDNQNTTICPSNSECKLGRCMCVDGFEWSKSSGSCIDIDECEKLSQPCLSGADVWTTNNKKNQWVTETFGEWRNISGGRAIIIEGKLLSNVTETSTYSTTTVSGVSQIIPLSKASFVTIPDSEENGAEVTSNEEISKSTEISDSTETTTSSMISDTSQQTLIPKPSKNAITKILEDLGIITTTKKVTSKPVLLITAGPNSIETLESSTSKAFSTTAASSESTFITDQAPSTTPAITTTTLPDPVTKIQKEKQRSKSKGSKKAKSTSQFTKATTIQPSTVTATKVESTVTASEETLTSGATTQSSTLSTKQTKLFPSETTRQFETTLRVVNNAELSRSTNNVQENFNTGNSKTSMMTEIMQSTTPQTSTSPTAKMTIKKSTKPKKHFKTTKSVAKNVKKFKTTKLPKFSTMNPTTSEKLSTTFTIAPESNFSSATTENDESFEMEVMVTMRSSTEQSTTLKTSTKKNSIESILAFPTSNDKGMQNSSTIIPIHPSTEFDIFIPNTPPGTTTEAQPRISLNMTFSSHNFSTTTPAAVTGNFETLTPPKSPLVLPEISLDILSKFKKPSTSTVTPLTQNENGSVFTIAPSGSTNITETLSPTLPSSSSTVTFISGSTTKSYTEVSTDNLTNDNKFLNSTNPPLITDNTFSSASTTKRKGMEMIFVDETMLASTDLTTVMPIDLTTIPNGSTTNEIITSGEKGLEISVIKTPFKQGSSTEIPDSGEMGLEISGKSSTIESKQPTETTNIAETSTLINLPETEIENPESGEHLTQEEIERIKKLKANETSTTTILLMTVYPGSTQSPSTTTAEDLREMGLELSGVSTPSSAEEFTSEPATAVSSTTENERATSTKTSDVTSESTTFASTTKTDASGEKSETVTTPSGTASSTPLNEKTSAKISPKSHESSFEKIPKSGEVGLEIGGSDLSDVSKEITMQPSSLSPEVTTIVQEETTLKKASSESVSTPSESSSTTEQAETSATTKISETSTDSTKTFEKQQQSTTSSSVTEEKGSTTSPEKTKESPSSVEESTTISAITSSRPDEATTSVIKSELQTTVTSSPTIASEFTTVKDISTEETTQQPSTITDAIRKTAMNTTPTTLTSPSTVQSEISS
uniref:EGF-like calcium-binding domain-containing protein n=1 Tax=Panagrolaimus sp. ES5 TaxID=591445 RepID=A0AC34FM56_9BILA